MSDAPSRQRTPPDEATVLRSQGLLLLTRALAEGWPGITPRLLDEIKEAIDTGPPELRASVFRRLERLYAEGEEYSEDFTAWWERRARGGGSSTSGIMPAREPLSVRPASLPPPPTSIPPPAMPPPAMPPTRPAALPAAQQGEKSILPGIMPPPGPSRFRRRVHIFIAFFFFLFTLVKLAYLLR